MNESRHRDPQDQARPVRDTVERKPQLTPWQMAEQVLGKKQAAAEVAEEQLAAELEKIVPGKLDELMSRAHEVSEQQEWAEGTSGSFKIVSSLNTVLKDKLSSTAHRGIEPILTRTWQICEDAEIQEHETRRIAAEECVALRNRIATNTDWEKFVNKAADDPKFTGQAYSTIQALRTGIESPRSQAAELHECAKQLRQNNLDYPPEERFAPPEVSNQDFLKETKNWLDTTNATLSYLNPDEFEIWRDRLKATSVDKLYNLATMCDLDQPDTNVPQQFLDTLKAVTIHRTLDFEDANTQYIEARWTERTQLPPIHNATLLADRFDISDPEAWVHERLQRFDPRLLNGLNSIQIVEMSPEQKAAFDNNQPYTMASYSRDERIIFIVAHPYGVAHKHERNIKIMTTIMDEPLTEEQKAQRYEFTKDKLHQDLEESITHEVGHHIHGYTLPIAWLRSWDEVAMRENEPLDEYHKSVLNNPKRYVQMADRHRVEGMAIALQYYFTNAYNMLNEKGIQRFLKLNQTFGRYDEKRALEICLNNIRQG